MLRSRRRGWPGPAGSARPGGLAFYVLWALREPPRRLGWCGRALSGLGSPRAGAPARRALALSGNAAAPVAAPLPPLAALPSHGYFLPCILAQFHL